MCECTMSVHSRTVNVLLNKRLSIVLHNVSVSITDPVVLEFSLASSWQRSSAQSSSQSEDVDTEFINMYMSDRRRWQDGGSAVS